MSFALWQYQRLAEGSAWERDLTRYARYTWRRTSRAMGGYWTGDFVIAGLASYKLEQLYSTLIGKRIVESSYGFTTWEGEIAELSLTLDGVTNTQSLDNELWHNKVKTQYTYPKVDDIEQGNLAYVSPAGNDGFQDDTQDFSDWETAAPGTASYEITVTNDDDSTCQAYCGDAFATGGANDSVYVYTDLELTTRGWNGDTGGKTPASYVISHTTLAGTQLETSWSENVASSDIYGESQYIDVIPDECYAAAAEAARDKRLTEHAYPRSMPAGGLSFGEPQSGGNQLSVVCAGYVFSMNRRFHETNVEPLYVSTQIETLVSASEYVTDGGILENDTISVPLTGADMTFKLWDGIEGLTEMGNSSGVRYKAGVWEDQLFRYDQAETEMMYEWRNGQLRSASGQIIPPTLITPDIIVRLQAPLSLPPPGGSAWDRPPSVYITEVEFVAPNSYRLIPEEGDILVYQGPPIQQALQMVSGTPEQQMARGRQ
jgi:hypothetical protein